MPRIPARVTPYTTPSLQNRHFKSKRDQVLRLLGKSSFINGSQFAILWVSARGEVETYASEGLQSGLTEWFGESMMGQAREMARVAAEKKGVAMEEEVERENKRRRKKGVSVKDESDSFSASILTPTSPSFPGKSLDETLSDDDSSLSDDESPSHAQLPPSPGLSATSSSAPSPSPLKSTSAATVTIHPDELDKYYAARFCALQQHLCKLIAKCWIKVIEPKKQTNFPYNKGEEGKPSWWPADVRHREPDHLMKPERIQLLTTIIRHPSAPAIRLELSTAEEGHLIAADKAELLREIYRVSREEERRRIEGRHNDATPIVVPTHPDCPPLTGTTASTITAPESSSATTPTINNATTPTAAASTVPRKRPSPIYTSAYPSSSTASKRPRPSPLPLSASPYHYNPPTSATYPSYAPPSEYHLQPPASAPPLQRSYSSPSTYPPQSDWQQPQQYWLAPRSPSVDEHMAAYSYAVAPAPFEAAQAAALHSPIGTAFAHPPSSLDYGAHKPDVRRPSSALASALVQPQLQQHVMVEQSQSTTSYPYASEFATLGDVV